MQQALVIAYDPGEFQIGGILGMDLLRAARAVIDLDRLTIDFA